MSTPRNVAMLIGSLRKGSYNRLAAEALAKLAPKELSLKIVEIGDLDLYNEDVDTKTPPKAWTVFRNSIIQADAVLFVTPEYNRSVPGVLKNALDVGSRPYGKSIWSKKPAAVMSVSPGAIGGFGANQHLRQSFVFLDMPVLQQPEAYIGQAAKIFEDNGDLVEGSRVFFKRFIDAFAELIEGVLRQ